MAEEHAVLRRTLDGVQVTDRDGKAWPVTVSHITLANDFYKIGFRMTRDGMTHTGEIGLGNSWKPAEIREQLGFTARQIVDGDLPPHSGAAQ